MTQRVVTGGRLSPAQGSGVLARAEAAAAADSVRPLSEHVLLHLRHDEAGPDPDPGRGADLVLTLDEEIAGYAYLDPPEKKDAEVSGELVIHPRHRRRRARPGGRLRPVPRPMAAAPVPARSAGPARLPGGQHAEYLPSGPRRAGGAEPQSPGLR